jgi:hypothetical protein
MIKSTRVGIEQSIFKAFAVACVALMAGCRSPVPSSHWVFEPAPRPITNAMTSAPQLLVLTSGTILATLVEENAEHENELGFYSSSTDGDVFTRTLQLNAPNTDVHPHLEGTPLLRVGRPGAYFAFWTGNGDDHLPMELNYSRSNDFGHSFSAPSPLDAQSGGSHPYFNAAAMPDGTVLVVWIAYDMVKGAAPGSGVLQMIRSSDGGATFSAPQRIAIDVCPCCRPELKADPKGNWYLAWRHVDADQERDIVVASSRDNGLTWSKETRVSRDGWHINGCPDSGPSLSFMGKKTFVAWHTVVDGKQRTFWTESDDGGRSFAARKDLGPSVHDPNHPYLVNVGDRVIAVFQGRDQNEQAGWGRERIYFREIAPVTVSTVATLPAGTGSATYPIGAALGPREIMIAWTDIADSGSRTLCLRGRLDSSDTNRE